MSLEEACQAAVIFKIELKACLLEAWSYINPRMLAKIFQRNCHSIWNLSKLFWMDETPQQPDIMEDPTEVLFLKDLLPHLTPRKKKVSFYPLEDTTIGDYSDTRTHKDYLTDPSPLHARRVRVTITAKHVGSSPRTTERVLHVGCGCLHDSIMGPQYFHGSSPPVPPRLEATEILQEINTLEIRMRDDPIWINDLPGSQDSEEGSDDNRDNRH